MNARRLILSKISPMFLVYDVVGCAYHGISFVNQVMTSVLVEVTIPAVDQVVDLVITADSVAQVTTGEAIRRRDHRMTVARLPPLRRANRLLARQMNCRTKIIKSLARLKWANGVVSSIGIKFCPFLTI